MYGGQRTLESAHSSPGLHTKGALYPQSHLACPSLSFNSSHTGRPHIPRPRNTDSAMCCNKPRKQPVGSRGRSECVRPRVTMCCPHEQGQASESEGNGRAFSPGPCVGVDSVRRKCPPYVCNNPAQFYIINMLRFPGAALPPPETPDHLRPALSVCLSVSSFLHFLNTSVNCIPGGMLDTATDISKRPQLQFSRDDGIDSRLCP